MKFRFALLVAALALALSISAFAYSEEPAQDAAAPAQEETTSEDSAPFVLLRVYEGQFTDVKDGDWFASPVVSAYEYGVLNGRSESSFAPTGNVTIAARLTIAAHDRQRRGHPRREGKRGVVCAVCLVLEEPEFARQQL